MTCSGSPTAKCGAPRRVGRRLLLFCFVEAVSLSQTATGPAAFCVIGSKWPPLGYWDQCDYHGPMHLMKVLLGGSGVRALGPLSWASQSAELDEVVWFMHESLWLHKRQRVQHRFSCRNLGIVRAELGRISKRPPTPDLRPILEGALVEVCRAALQLLCRGRAQAWPEAPPGAKPHDYVLPAIIPARRTSSNSADQTLAATVSRAMPLSGATSGGPPVPLASRRAACAQQRALGAAFLNLESVFGRVPEVPQIYR